MPCLQACGEETERHEQAPSAGAEHYRRTIGCLANPPLMEIW